MKIWARVTYVVTLLIMATLPFDPLLNQRFLVFPVGVICVVLGLIAMYVSTFPDNAGHAGKGGTP
jgi:hypothetical protein